MLRPPDWTWEDDVIGLAEASMDGRRDDDLKGDKGRLMLLSSREDGAVAQGGSPADVVTIIAVRRDGQKAARGNVRIMTYEMKVGNEADGVVESLNGMAKMDCRRVIEVGSFRPGLACGGRSSRTKMVLLPVHKGNGVDEDSSREAKDGQGCKVTEVGPPERVLNHGIGSSQTGKVSRHPNRGNDEGESQTREKEDAWGSSE